MLLWLKNRWIESNMMKKHKIIIISFLGFVFSTNAAEKYVTDDIDIYVRRGPGANYGFSGAVKTGQKVTSLEKSDDGKYTRVQISNGKIAWIETSKLNDEPSYRERLPELEAKLAEYQDKVNNIDEHQRIIVNEYEQKLQSAEKLIETLQNKNTDLEKQVKQQKTQIDSMLNQVDDKRLDLILTWFTYGGLVAGGGLVLGLILPMIMPRRKKDRWMR